MKNIENTGLVLKGYVKFTELDVNGNILRVSKQNLVVDKCREVIRNSLLSAPSLNYISKIELGDNNLTYGDGTSGIAPPALGDLSLVNTFFSKAVTTSPQIEGGRFAILSEVTIENSEANDPVPGAIKLVTEFGLFTASPVMVARVTNPIAKSSASSIKIEWLIVI